MDFELLMGRYLRLRQELSIAYRAQSWHADRIDWLADQIAATEREIAACQPVDEHSDESYFGSVH